MTIWDKSGSPYVSKSDFDLYFNIKYNDWVEILGKAVEQDERLMADLMFLYKPFTKANSAYIDRVVDVPDFRRRLRFNATFPNCFSDLPNIVRNVRILINATIDEAQNDPNTKGIDNDPCCIATNVPPNNNPGWQVFSNTVPVALNMTYIKVPQTIDSANNPNTVFEAPDYIANYIIRAVVYRLDITVQDYERAKAEKSDVEQALS